MKNNPFTLIYSAGKTVLTYSRSYRVWFFALFIIFVALYLFAPVWLTPGNSISFQFSLLRVQDYILFISLSAITALLVIMQAFLFKESKSNKANIVGQGGVGAFSAFFGGLLATATCSACIAAILGFLGAGSVLFIVEQQPYFVAITLGIVAIGLYFTARRIKGYCKNCGIDFK